MARRSTGAVTLMDVSRVSGFSKSVVSRALLGQPGVNAETARAVTEVAQRLGYAPNLLARGLVGARTTTIGLVLRDSRSAFYSELSGALSEQAHRAGYRVISVGSVEDDSSYDPALKHLVQLQVDGLLISSSAVDAEAIHATGREIPTVVVGRGQLDYPSLSSVSLARDAPADLVDLLRAGGHEKVGLLHHSRQASRTQFERNERTLDLMTDAGMTVTRVVMREEDVSSAVTEVLGRGVTAILCAADPLALTVLGELQARGIDVPDEVSVVGFDGVGPLAHPYLGLSTYRLPIEAMAREAIGILVGQIEDPAQDPVAVELTGEVVRGRTAKLGRERAA